VQKLTTLFCEKENVITKSKEVKTGSTLAGSSKEGCRSKWAVLPMMMSTSVLMKLKMLSN
jgi:hypothetical protein